MLSTNAKIEKNQKMTCLYKISTGFCDVRLVT